MEEQLVGDNIFALVALGAKARLKVKRNVPF